MLLVWGVPLATRGHLYVWAASLPTLPSPASGRAGALPKPWRQQQQPAAVPSSRLAPGRPGPRAAGLVRSPDRRR